MAWQSVHPESLHWRDSRSCFFPEFRRHYRRLNTVTVQLKVRGKEENLILKEAEDGQSAMAGRAAEGATSLWSKRPPGPVPPASHSSNSCTYSRAPPYPHEGRNFFGEDEDEAVWPRADHRHQRPGLPQSRPGLRTHRRKRLPATRGPATRGVSRRASQPAADSLSSIRATSTRCKRPATTNTVTSAPFYDSFIRANFCNFCVCAFLVKVQLYFKIYLCVFCI